MELAHEIVEAEKFSDLQLESQQWPSRNFQSKSQDLETWDVGNVSRRVPKNRTSLCPQAEEIECPQKRREICLFSASAPHGIQVEWTVLTNRDSTGTANLF